MNQSILKDCVDGGGISWHEYLVPVILQFGDSCLPTFMLNVVFALIEMKKKKEKEAALVAEEEEEEVSIKPILFSHSHLYEIVGSMQTIPLHVSIAMGCHGIVRDSDYPPQIPPILLMILTNLYFFLLIFGEPLVPPRRSLVPAHRSPPNSNQDPFSMLGYLGLMKGSGVGSIKMYESLNEWSLPRTKFVFDL
ncbi:OLC1v1015934C1 [Oldenlandia corymbosa var. corymbosa]|uniref:OLC1v1015934C1 n=1 Tax=Oldenlandia corymbosa var. corymbosa TaxID=529605 RepID=A0AAV1E4J0_OLDCO|nr:OLC1v1015934C1 [Oldenlandia corymbosa var. corymbosa]